MPLINSDSEKAFKHNIAKLIKEGYPRDQALAIAHDIKRKAARKGKKK